MKLKKLKYIIITTILCLALLILPVAKLNVSVDASTSSSYIYDFWKNVIPSTEGLTYKDTYYYNDITSINDGSNLYHFDSIIDMETYDEVKKDDDGNTYYESTLYLLDQANSATTEITFNGTTFTETGASKIIVMNQNLQYSTVVDEFLITDEVKAKLDEYYHFGTWEGLREQDKIELSEITQKMFQSEELVDIYDVIDVTKKVEKNTETNELFISFDTIEYNTNRGSSLELYNNGQLIDSSKYQIELVNALEYAYYDVDNNKNTYDLAKLVKKLEDNGINVITSYKNIEKVDYITEVKGNFTITSGEDRSFESSKDLYKTEGMTVEVLVNSEVISADNYTIDAENGKVTFNESYLSTLEDGKYDVVINVNTGTRDYYKNVIIVAQNDGEAGKDIISSANPTSTVTTYVVFDDVQEGNEIRAWYKYISIQGRAPYVPYSQDNTKAAIYLKRAMGITVTDDAIYVADTDNSRILKMTKDFVVTDVILTPEDSEFYQVYNATYQTEYGEACEVIKSTTSWYNTVNTKLVFKPRKIAVTPSGVCYCIAESAYQGLLEFGVNTLFNRYLGKNTVTVSAIKQLWSNIWTEEQYDSQGLDLPAMFNNIACSDEGFLYATSDPDTDATTNLNLVKIINTKGNDILKRNGYVAPDGDAVYQTASTKDGVILGSSLLSAVAVSKKGIYSVTDQRRGRIFTYDEEGNLLYITGNQPGGTDSAYTGGLSNSLVKPVAIDYLYRSYIDENGDLVNEETVLVLDSSSQTLLLFETTEFGTAVNTATDLYQKGNVVDTTYVNENGETVTTRGAESYWRDVIKMNTNYELAYLGIGKALNRNGQYQEAMKYFKLAHNAQYYSEAFSSYRDIVLNENFDLLMLVIGVVVVAAIVGKVCAKIVKKNKEGGLK